MPGKFLPHLCSMLQCRSCLLIDTSSKLALLAFMATWLLCMLSMPCLMLCKQDSHCSPPPLALTLQLDCEESLRKSRDTKGPATALMSYLLPHLHTGFAVDQAILSVSLQACKI